LLLYIEKEALIIKEEFIAVSSSAINTSNDLTMIGAITENLF
jgi:hypothetical protein